MQTLGGHRFFERGVGEEGAIQNALVDAGDIHLDDAAGADVQMAHFAVTHLPGGQADPGSGGFDEGPGVVAFEAVEGGLMGGFHGVAGSFHAVTHAVQNGQDDFLFHLYLVTPL